MPYQQKYQQPHQQQYHHPATHNVHVPVTHHVGGGVDAAAPILRSTSDISPDGHYSYEYETGNGIHAQEAGLASHSVQGSFGYTAPDGTPIQISYIADENGLYWFLQYLSIRKSLSGPIFALVFARLTAKYFSEGVESYLYVFYNHRQLL